MKRLVCGMAVMMTLIASPAFAQLGGARIGIEPYVGYGFFGQLPDGGPTLEAAVAYGGRASLQLSPRFALFGNFQRSDTEASGLFTSDVTVDHWSAGFEFGYVPRGGAEGMLPILLEAGVGQARYSFKGLPSDVDGLSDVDRSDIAVNFGLSSALRFSPGFAIRYGLNDYISNYDGRGITNQLFVRVGAELRF